MEIVCAGRPVRHRSAGCTGKSHRANGVSTSPGTRPSRQIVAGFRSTDDPERCSTRRSVMYLLQHSGYIQWCVLHTIGPDVLSPAGKSRLQELERKFPGEDVPAPKVYEAVRLGSSIPDAAAAKMSDDQWLAAIDKFEHQRNGADDPKTIQFGEASALAQQLQTASKSDLIDLRTFSFDSLQRHIPNTANTCFKAWQMPMNRMLAPWLRS